MKNLKKFIWGDIMQTKYIKNKPPVSKKYNDEYMRLYNEMVDNLIEKDRMIEAMQYYIIRHSIRTKSMCRIRMCNKKRMDRDCRKCISDYFERLI